MPFVLSVHVKNIRTGSEVAQILHSWGLPDLTSVCRGQESSASLDAVPASLEGWAILIGASQPLPLEVIMPFQVSAWSWRKCFLAIRGRNGQRNSS